MSLQDHIQELHLASLEAQRGAAAQLSEPIARAAELMVASLMREGKILACGQAGSFDLAGLFASLLTHQHQQSRPGLAAITLERFAPVEEAGPAYARQIESLGHAGDVLLVISGHGNSPGLLAALHGAHDKGMAVVVLAGGDGGQLAGALWEEDAVIGTHDLSPARTRELHLRAIHSLCDGIDYLLLGA